MPTGRLREEVVATYYTSLPCHQVSGLWQSLNNLTLWQSLNKHTPFGPEDYCYCCCSPTWPLPWPYFGTRFIQHTAFRNGPKLFELT